MSPRAFPCFMIAVDLGSNLKVARLTDREFRVLITGVWALAARATPRGYLAVAGEPASDRDVAHLARCAPAVARSTLTRMRALGMLEYESESGLEYCHDWHLLNPDPAPSDTPEARRQRKRAQREREASQNGHAPVTTDVTRDMPVTEVVTSRDSHETEVKGIEDNPPSEGLNSTVERGSTAELFAYWQEKCGHPQAKLTPERRRAIDGRLKQGYTVEQIQQAVDGAARGAHVSDSGKRFDDIELICRNGSKLESFMGRGLFSSTRPGVVNDLDRRRLESAQQLQRERSA